jgi:DNA-binding transcriptional LysR family regulator
MKIENVTDLQVLLHTARGGSLTAAANAMGITPAAASATLKRVEAQLGTRLFERSTRAMRLTTQGQIMLDYASRAFDLLGEGISQVTADRAEFVGEVRLAAPSDLARTILLPWLSEFLDMHSGLRLSISVGDKPLDVVRDEVDVAIRYGVLADSRLVARTLANSSPVLCASRSYLQRNPAPKTPQDLLKHNCLTYERNGRRHRLWRFSQKSQWTEVRVNGDRTVDDASLSRQWAVAGAGILLKSEIDVHEDLANGSLIRLMTDWDTEPYPLHAVLPSGRFIPNRVRAIVNFLALKFDDMLAAGLPGTPASSV